MLWFPTIEYIIITFAENIEQPTLMNRSGLLAALDKMKWGIPMQGKPSMWDSAVILFKDIVEQHFFMDGNKRIGILMVSLFLHRNDYVLDPAIGEIFRVTMDTAKGEETFEGLKEWFQNNTRIKH